MCWIPLQVYYNIEQLLKWKIVHNLDFHNHNEYLNSSFIKKIRTDWRRTCLQSLTFLWRGRKKRELRSDCWGLSQSPGRDGSESCGEKNNVDINITGAAWDLFYFRKSSQLWHSSARPLLRIPSSRLTCWTHFSQQTLRYLHLRSQTPSQIPPLEHLTLPRPLPLLLLPLLLASQCSPDPRQSLTCPGRVNL